MESSKNRREVEERLKAALGSDKANTETNAISKFGIVEMTRERLRPPYFDSINKKCEMCAGAGIIKSEETVAIAALRDIHTKASIGGNETINCRLPVESANYLINAKRSEIMRLEKEFDTKIHITADMKLLPGEFLIDVEKSDSSPPS